MNTRLRYLPLAAGLAIFAAGCATTGDDTNPTLSSSSADAEKERVISQQESRISNLEGELAAARAAADSAAASSASDSSGSMSLTGGDSSLLPPNPKPGECYARVIIPAKYETTTERVLKREASERIEIIPAQFGTISETVVVREASKKLEVIPAQYETVTEQVIVKPASTKIEVVPAVYDTVEERVIVKPASTRSIEVPAVYDTVTERVLDQPARTEWKRGTGIGSGGSGVGLASAAQTIKRFGDYKVVETRVEDTGDLMCLVEIPATYKNIEKQVLVTPATTRTVDNPAEYKTVKKTVLITPASTREIAIPAEYRTVEVTKQISPESTREIEIPAEYGEVAVTSVTQAASERRIPIPAEYATVERRNQLSDERNEWRPVLCEVNMTRQNVSALQASLNETGCCRCGPNKNECQVDGVIGQCTLKAAQCYAERNGLSSGDKYVTLDVVRGLGLEF